MALFNLRVALLRRISVAVLVGLFLESLIKTKKIFFIKIILKKKKLMKVY